MGNNLNKKKKKIALMLPNLEGGGAERTASELSRFFYDEGYDVYIFTERKRTHYDFKGKIILLKVRQSVYPLNRDISVMFSLAKEMKRKKKQYEIDVAISFMELYNLSNILSRGKEKVVLRVCTILSARKDFDTLYYNKHIIKYLYNRASEIVVLSKYGKDDMIKNYGIKKEIIRVIPNAVIPRKHENSTPWTYGVSTILSVNRIHPIKQQGIVIDAMRELVKKISDVKLILVGDNRNQYAKELMQKVKINGLENNIVFTGQVDCVEYYMQNSRIFVITSLVEGFSNVILEAMNQGLPIVAMEYIGPSREILGIGKELGYGRYGIMIPRINESVQDVEYWSGVKRLSEVLFEILSNQKVYKKYQDASYKRAQYYAKEKIEAMWKKIL